MTGSAATWREELRRLVVVLNEMLTHRVVP